MVSTRGPRYKFAEGEKVLCYEPDPTKAKVLYDSKVLEIIKTKDKRGRPVVEYLIHFQGWNSSWDRCVSEDFVLKDTEENRQLQRSLAEKSQLQIGTYLYRRERKKLTSTSNSSTNSQIAEKRARKRGLECEGSSSSCDPEEREDSDTSSQTESSCTTTEEQKSESALDNQSSAVSTVINLGPGLKERLSLDFHLIVNQGRFATIPARPNVLEILEGCVKSFATKEAALKLRPRRSRMNNPPQPQELLSELLNKLSILQEIADGIRVYFDYCLNGHLLYRQEYSQYKEAVAKNIIREARRETGEKEDLNVRIVKTERNSPYEEFSHSSPSPKAEESQSNTSVRRLRSHKLSQASETSEENAPITPISTVPPSECPMPVSASPQGEMSSSSCDIRAAVAEAVNSWHIVPEDYPPFPSSVYGAAHLARLFVKLPEFLSAINMAEMKLKMIIKNIEVFVDYLEEHEDWFGESFYSEASPGPS